MSEVLSNDLKALRAWLQKHRPDRPGGTGLSAQAWRDLVDLVQEARDDAQRGIRWRVEAACDGYEHLMDDDVPRSEDTASYQNGAAAAARAIREVLA